MDYRDALEAALSRVAALEAELAARPGEIVESEQLRSQRDALAKRVAALEGDIASAQKQLAISEKRLAETLSSIREPERTGAGMKTLYEHNLKQAPLATRDNHPRAKVSCPRCAAEAKASVEMMVAGMSMDWGRSNLVSAICPRCAFTGYVRHG